MLHRHSIHFFIRKFLTYTVQLINLCLGMALQTSRMESATLSIIPQPISLPSPVAIGLEYVK
jgi:hypothetical protein